ncbi:unnamed protein product, partial [Discosporangium mesarthrocarpum]
SRAPVPEGEREHGRVCSIKESFGFIGCLDRTGDIFFHLTEAPVDIKLGDEVEFFRGMGGRSGRDCALQVTVLAPGTLVFEKILEGHYVGVVERDIRNLPSKYISSQRAQMMGRSRTNDQQPVEGLIKVQGLAPLRQDSSTAPTKDADSGSVAAQEGEGGGQENISPARDATVGTGIGAGEAGVN